jgi:hypothetical protein
MKDREINASACFLAALFLVGLGFFGGVQFSTRGGQLNVVLPAAKNP